MGCDPCTGGDVVAGAICDVVRGGKLRRERAVSDLVEGDGLGSRESVRETLDRVRNVLSESRERRIRSGGALGRASELLAGSEVALQDSQAVREQLRAAVMAYVHRLHADGEPPERVLVLVKSAVRDAVPAEFSVADEDRLVADAVRWSIEAYFAA